MKQGQNARKGRARNNSRKNQNNNGGNRSENRVRGNPKQHLEKYKTQAREALQAGDRVTAEYYFQFADHYQRVLNSMQKDQPPKQNKSDDDKDTSAEQKDEQQGDENQQKPRRQSRQRRERGPRRKPSDDANNEDTSKDPGAGDQPKEVHPELDLPFLNNPAPTGEESAAEEDKKPASKRRGRPRKKATEDGEIKSDKPSDEEAA